MCDKMNGYKQQVGLSAWVAFATVMFVWIMPTAADVLLDFNDFKEGERSGRDVLFQGVRFHDAKLHGEGGPAGFSIESADSQKWPMVGKAALNFNGYSRGPGWSFGAAKAWSISLPADARSVSLDVVTTARASGNLLIVRALKDGKMVAVKNYTFNIKKTGDRVTVNIAAPAIDRLDFEIARKQARWFFAGNLDNLRIDPVDDAAFVRAAREAQAAWEANLPPNRRPRANQPNNPKPAPVPQRPEPGPLYLTFERTAPGRHGTSAVFDGVRFHEVRGREQKDVLETVVRSFQPNALPSKFGRSALTFTLKSSRSETATYPFKTGRVSFPAPVKQVIFDLRSFPAVRANTLTVTALRGGVRVTDLKIPLAKIVGHPYASITVGAKSFDALLLEADGPASGGVAAVILDNFWITPVNEQAYLQAAKQVERSPQVAKAVTSPASKPSKPQPSPLYLTFENTAPGVYGDPAVFEGMRVHAVRGLSENERLGCVVMSFSQNDATSPFGRAMLAFRRLPSRNATSRTPIKSCRFTFPAPVKQLAFDLFVSTGARSNTLTVTAFQGDRRVTQQKVPLDKVRYRTPLTVEIRAASFDSLLFETDGPYSKGVYSGYLDNFRITPVNEPAYLLAAKQGPQKPPVVQTVTPPTQPTPQTVVRKPAPDPPSGSVKIDFKSATRGTYGREVTIGGVRFYDAVDVHNISQYFEVVSGNHVYGGSRSQRLLAIKPTASGSTYLFNTVKMALHREVDYARVTLFGRPHRGDLFLDGLKDGRVVATDTLRRSTSRSSASITQVLTVHGQAFDALRVRSSNAATAAYLAIDQVDLHPVASEPPWPSVAEPTGALPALVLTSPRRVTTAHGTVAPAGSVDFDFANLGEGMIGPAFSVHGVRLKNIESPRRDSVFVLDAMTDVSEKLKIIGPTGLGIDEYMPGPTYRARPVSAFSIEADSKIDYAAALVLSPRSGDGLVFEGIVGGRVVKTGPMARYIKGLGLGTLKLVVYEGPAVDQLRLATVRSREGSTVDLIVSRLIVHAVKPVTPTRETIKPTPVEPKVMSIRSWSKPPDAVQALFADLPEGDLGESFVFHGIEFSNLRSTVSSFKKFVVERAATRRGTTSVVEGRLGFNQFLPGSRAASYDISEFQMSLGVPADFAEVRFRVKPIGAATLLLEGFRDGQVVVRAERPYDVRAADTKAVLVISGQPFDHARVSVVQRGATGHGRIHGLVEAVAMRPTRPIAASRAALIPTVTVNGLVVRSPAVEAGPSAGATGASSTTRWPSGPRAARKPSPTVTGAQSDDPATGSPARALAQSDTHNWLRTGGMAIGGVLALVLLIVVGIYVQNMITRLRERSAAAAVTTSRRTPSASPEPVLLLTSANEVESPAPQPGQLESEHAPPRETEPDIDVTRELVLELEQDASRSSAPASPAKPPPMPNARPQRRATPGGAPLPPSPEERRERRNRRT